MQAIKSGTYKAHEKYMGVYQFEFIRAGKNCGLKFRGQLTIRRQQYVSKLFDVDRDAAKWCDLKRIEHGLEPVNILKRKDKT